MIPPVENSVEKPMSTERDTKQGRRRRRLTTNHRAHLETARHDKGNPVCWTKRFPEEFEERNGINRMRSRMNFKVQLVMVLLLLGFGCAAHVEVYHDPDMDFAAVKSVAVMPFQNLTNDKMAGERVRDMFINKLLATGAMYVFPPGEVARALARSEAEDPTSPSGKDVVQIGAILRVDAIITGTVREYKEVRSGSVTDNVVSLSLRMIEVKTKRVVWTASSTRGGIDFLDRLFGSGGKPMNDVTQEAVEDVINKLFY